MGLNILFSIIKKICRQNFSAAVFFIELVFKKESPCNHIISKPVDFLLEKKLINYIYIYIFFFFIIIIIIIIQELHLNVLPS